MGKHFITLELKEYKSMLEMVVRLEAFSDFVRKSEYSIDRESCALYLGFDLSDEKAEEK